MAFKTNVIALAETNRQLLFQLKKNIEANDKVAATATEVLIAANTTLIDAAILAETNVSLLQGTN